MSDRISKNREKKEKIVAELSEKVERAKALVFTNYQGMTHKQLEDLKKALRAVNADLVVAKNTLLARALANSEFNPSTKLGTRVQNSEFKNPTATLFAYEDPLAPLKELAKIIKTLKIPTIKFGILDGKAITGEEVLKLASLPSREVLIAQVVGGMKAPIFGLHRALNWNLQKLVLTLEAIQKTKQASSN